MKNFFRNLPLRFDRSFSKGLFRQVLWLVGIMAIVYVILAGLSGISALYSPGSEDSQGKWYDILLVLIDPGSGSSSMSTPFTILCALLGLIIFSGMLISVISNVLERRVESYTKGETDYNVSNHVVVLGFNKSVPSLLNKVHEKHKDSFIILMSEQDSENIRDWIHASVEPKVEDLLIVMNGSRVSDDDLGRLRLDKGVKEIFVLGEEGEDAHDAMSLECVKRMAILMSECKDVECHVQIDSHTMYAVLQSVDFSDSTFSKSDKTDKIGNHLKFLPFNFNEIWSQKALATIPNEFVPLDGTGIMGNSQKHVHLIVVGMNEMGTALAINAAHILHFPNFKEGDFSTYSHITFIDSDACHQGQAFRNRFRHLFDVARWRQVEGIECRNDGGWIDPIADADSKSPYRHLGPVNFMDIQWEFIEGDVFDNNVQEYLVECSLHEDEITTIALCDDNSEENASFCLALPESICKKANTILVRQKETSVTIDLIQQLPGHEKIRPFGMMTECYGENLISDKYGKIVNACYSGIDIDGLLTPNRKECTEKDIDEKWLKCSILNKWSSIYSANMLFTKLRSMGFAMMEGVTRNEIDERINQADIQDEIQRTEHNRWNTEKLLLGFSPLTKEEQDEFAPLRDQKKTMKEQKKEWTEKKMKHLDLCSNETLKVIDKYAVGFDNDVNSKLWVLYTMTK